MSDNDDSDMPPTLKDTPAALQTSQEIKAVRVEPSVTTAYRMLYDALQAYQQLPDELKDKVAGFIPSAAIIALINVLERHYMSLYR